MAEKQDCCTVEEAMERLHVSRTTLYGYINFLRVQRIKFSFDRKTYILKSEVDRIEKYMEEVRR